MSRIEQLKKILELEPDDVFTNFALAMEYVKERQHEQALNQFMHVAEIDPDYVPAYFQRGNLLITMNRRDEARAALEEGIATAERIGDSHAASEMRDTLNAIG